MVNASPFVIFRCFLTISNLSQLSSSIENGRSFNDMVSQAPKHDQRNYNLCPNWLCVVKLCTWILSMQSIHGFFCLSWFFKNFQIPSFTKFTVRSRPFVVFSRPFHGFSRLQLHHKFVMWSPMLPVSNCKCDSSKPLCGHILEVKFLKNFHLRPHIGLICSSVIGIDCNFI